MSGAHWAERFPGSVDTRYLVGTFRQAVDDFIYAMTEAGMKVRPDSTFRPEKRSYLMHWCYRIAKEGVDPEKIPPMDGVDIEWNHTKKSESVRAANEMIAALGMRRLRTAPARKSLHNLGRAIDMTISWTGTVSIKDADGNLVTIKTSPRTGMNARLQVVGASYGVKKFIGGMKDIPHWSNTGR